MRPLRWCSPVNFANFRRTPFLQNTSGRLLLKARDREAATSKGCSIKMLLLKVLQYSQENT